MSPNTPWYGQLLFALLGLCGLLVGCVVVVIAVIAAPFVWVYEQTTGRNERQ